MLKGRFQYHIVLQWLLPWLILVTIEYFINRFFMLHHSTPNNLLKTVFSISIQLRKMNDEIVKIVSEWSSSEDIWMDCQDVEGKRNDIDNCLEIYRTNMNHTRN